MEKCKRYISMKETNPDIAERMPIVGGLIVPKMRPTNHFGNI